MALKKWYPDFAFSGNQVAPSEIDRYEVYQVICPAVASGIATTWVASAGTSGTADAVALTFNNVIADYPRNV